MGLFRCALSAHRCVEGCGRVCQSALFEARRLHESRGCYGAIGDVAFRGDTIWKEASKWAFSQ